MNTLYKTLEGIGFDKKDIKASVIRVNTKYTHKQGNDVFAGYAYRTTMNLYFEFDSDLLGKIFPAMADSGINPQIRISFTVKDKEEIKNRLLSAAAKGARNKASILCEAMDVKLGKLIKINYNWDEIDIYSNTAYMRDYAVSIGSAPSYESEIEFSPEDIDITDDAVFVWEIE